MFGKPLSSQNQTTWKWDEKYWCSVRRKNFQNLPWDFAIFLERSVPMGWNAEGRWGQAVTQISLQWIQPQAVWLQFAFRLYLPDNFQRSRQRAFVHAEDASGCLHSWRLVRSLGRAGIVSKDFSYAPGPGADQQCYRPYIYSLIAAEWDGEEFQLDTLTHCATK